MPNQPFFVICNEQKIQTWFEFKHGIVSTILFSLLKPHHAPCLHQAVLVMRQCMKVSHGRLSIRVMEDSRVRKASLKGYDMSSTSIWVSQCCVVPTVLPIRRQPIQHRCQCITSLRLVARRVSGWQNSSGGK